MSQDAADIGTCTLQDDTGLRLTLLDWGATWWSLQCPVPGEDQPRELLLGGATPQAHLHNTAYFGATIGRMANRIAGAQIERDGRRWALVPQPGSPHQLHGGPDGFDRRRWAMRASGRSQAEFRLLSPDGDQGYPGAVTAEATVSLPGQGVIDLALRATTTAPTPVGLTNHAYFNLDGTRSDARQHGLAIAASQVLPVDEALIPLGPLQPVAGTPFDFRAERPIGGAAEGVYDHAFLLDGSAGLRPAATLTAADGRVQLCIETTLPALQLYTGAHLDGQSGRDGRRLPRFAGIALEPQFLPDSPHHPEWPQPSCWLLPGQVWSHHIRYRLRCR
jgi:aldose 1-epimerase